MISILMGCYNGANFLPDQLQSFSDQSHKSWRLICSDDGSMDGTPAVLQDFASNVPQQVVLHNGPQTGFSANYMKLLRELTPDTDFVALADQDDIWMPDKLERALGGLKKCEPGRPALYTAQRWIWDSETNRRCPTPLPTRPPSFRNALIENIAPGNTIVMNQAAAELARKAAEFTGNVFAHDWWLYLLITGAGGQVFVDDGPPCLLYRQHDGNAIGGRQTLTAQKTRKIAVLKGAFRSRLQENLTALSSVSHLLTTENNQLAQAFASARQAGSATSRLRGLWRVRPYRQTSWSSLGFWGAAALGKV